MLRLNYTTVAHLMGFLLIFNGGFMLTATGVSLWYGDGAEEGIATAALCVLLVGLNLMFFTRHRKTDFGQKEGFLVVSLGWIIMSLSGTLPYLLTGSIPSFTNAFFETMSGYTTTGASILNDIEVIPRGVLFWRSLTQWIGGMGIIVLAIAILPLLKIGGMQLFGAEAPGPSVDKLKPTIVATARRLWGIYFGLTLLEVVLLYFAGMTWFDAVNHALTTMSSGGFSTKNASAAFWNEQPVIQYILILFMFFAGTNFVLLYYLFKRNLSKIRENEEFRWYAGSIIFLSVITSLTLYFRADLDLSSVNHPQVWGEAESSFRHAAFQVTSLITTTGFVSSDYGLWPPLLVMLMLGLLFLGGSAGSTSGGVKIMRHLIIIKNGGMEFRRKLHPNAVLPVRYNGRPVKKVIVYKILAFFVLYLILFIIGASVFASFGLDMKSAIGGAATSLGNVGPALGSLGPVNNFDALPVGAKWWAAFLMFVGRLELFTVLILFTPYYWRNY